MFLNKSLLLQKKAMYKLPQFILLFLLFANLAQAQTLLLDETQLPRFESTITIPSGVTPSHTSVNFRGNFDAALANSFQLALETLLSDLDSKGLSAAIVADNGDEWTGAAGVSHTGTPMTTDMYLGMGSVSKSVTAACILKLEEEGLLSIDDSIGTYLPAFPNVLNIITIQQLLNHTSGLYNFIDHPSMLDSMKEDFSRIWQPEEVLNNFVNAPYFLPGLGWHYSNTNYVLAGLIIEKVTNQSYHDVVRQKLFEPVGLGNLFLNPYETAPGDIAHVWLQFPGLGKLDMDALNLTPISVYSAAWAAGAYFSQPILATKWMKSLLDGDILSASSMNKMLEFVPANSIKYGLGLMKLSNGNQSFIGHQGYIIYSSLSFYDPVSKLTISIQSNDGTSTDLSAFLIKAYLLYINSLVGNQTITSTLKAAYPNPADNYIQLDLPQHLTADFDIMATDVLGRRLAAKIINQDDQSIKLDISHWPNGQYQISVATPNQRFIYKIIHQ